MFSPCSSVVVVIVVMGLEYFFPELLLSPVNVCIQLISIVPNRELLIIIDWDVDLHCANRFVVRVVKLSNVWMLQCLLSCQSLVWIKMHQVL